VFVGFWVAIVMIGVVVAILARAGALEASVDNDVVVALRTGGEG
jgi:hypothetical protein